MQPDLVSMEVRPAVKVFVPSLVALKRLTTQKSYALLSQLCVGVCKT